MNSRPVPRPMRSHCPGQRSTALRGCPFDLRPMRPRAEANAGAKASLTRDCRCALLWEGPPPLLPR